jgi:hypothetical protein
LLCSLTLFEYKYNWFLIIDCSCKIDYKMILMKNNTCVWQNIYNTARAINISPNTRAIFHYYFSNRVISYTKQFVKRGSISGRCTRNSQSFNIPFYKSATGQRLFYYRAVSLWNTLPANIKTSTSINIFKSKLRRHLL